MYNVLSKINNDALIATVSNITIVSNTCSNNNDVSNTGSKAVVLGTQAAIAEVSATQQQ
jgi:hypothetical protein